ncbi:abortive infection family protein [bacterium]|nr:abortive infection family protein [bacterium]MBU1984213.1 abortive infection family protein [bacterium]
MSELNSIEKSKLEKLFGMGSGYVLDFPNRRFAEFIVESTGKDIYDARYENASGSKANRLRAFWSKEPNHVVGRLIADMLEYCRESSADQQNLWVDCHHIAERLLQSMPVQDIEAFSIVSGGRDFEVLADAVKAAIERNEPESGLDRLHTFVVKYIRALCDKHGLKIDKQKPLHNLFGEYVKCLRQQGIIESGMTERILKSSISIMEAFNQVRNEQSLAHDNPILNYNESLLILSHVASTIRFIGVMEGEREELDQSETHNDVDNDDLPF